MTPEDAAHQGRKDGRGEDVGGDGHHLADSTKSAENQQKYPHTSSGTARTGGLVLPGVCLQELVG